MYLGPIVLRRPHVRHGGVEKHRMNVRRALALSMLILTAALFFALGLFQARTSEARVRAAYDAKLDGIRAEVRSEFERPRQPEAPGVVGIVGHPGSGRSALDAAGEAPGKVPRAQMIAEITQQLE